MPLDEAIYLLEAAGKSEIQARRGAEVSENLAVVMSRVKEEGPPPLVR